MKKNNPSYMQRQYQQKQGYSEDGLQILNNRPNTGYAVTIPNRTATNTNTWNSVLLDHQGRSIKMWVYEIGIDFGLSGTYSQSRYRRQFFPRSFNQTNVSVVGQMPNQKEYNTLAAFVRESHFSALSGNNNAIYQTDASGNQTPPASPSSQLLKLIINPYEPSGSSFSKTLTNKSAQTKNPKNIKGSHSRLMFDGYIKNIAAGAEKFNFAPEFKFDFIVTQAYLNGNTGIYDDSSDLGSQLSNISELIKTTGFNGLNNNNFYRPSSGRVAPTSTSSNSNQKVAIPSTIAPFNSNGFLRAPNLTDIFNGK